MSVALSVSRLRKSFVPGLRLAVDDVSFIAEPGEIIVLLGPSGCGKTTTLRMVAGLEQPTTGSIRIDNQPVFDSDSHAWVAPQNRQIGMVFQSYAVWPHMTVSQNVAYPLLRRKRSRSSIRELVAETLSLVGLEDYIDRSVMSLSGGQMQRVALARALVYEPRILLLDEPLSNLDAKLRLRLRDDLRRIIKKLGLTALYVTHDQEEAVVIGDRIGVMKDGRLLQMSRAVDLYNAPVDLFVANFTGVTNVFPGKMKQRTGALGTIALARSDYTLVARVGRDIEEGDAVTVGVRPENITLQKLNEKSPLAQGEFAARIVDCHFRGGQSVYTVSAFDTQIDVIELGTVPRFEQGHSVVLRISPELCWAFPASS